MEILKLPDPETVNDAVRADSPLVAAIAFDGSRAAVIPAAYFGGYELFALSAGIRGEGAYFKLAFNSHTADWSFDCPEHYAYIYEPEERTAAYYRDGLSMIPEFLMMLGYFSKLNIKDAPPDIWAF